MSVYDVLKQDHDEVKALMAQIEACGDEETPRRNQLFNEMKERLILHSKAEEKAFYLPLMAYQQTEEEVKHGKQEHEEAETLMKELTDSSLNGAAWQQKFRTLKEMVEHHIDEEENEIFPDAEAVIDAQTKARMETNMKELKDSEAQVRTIEKRVAA